VVKIDWLNWPNRDEPTQMSGLEHLLSSRRQHPRRRSSAGVETLPPEPVQANPLSLHPSPRARTPPSEIEVRLPSVLSLVQTTHRYSSYVLSAFLGLHTLNTCIIPLVTLVSSHEDALSTIDNGFMITRFVYRPSPAIEVGLILLPLGLHVISGAVLRIRRVFRERNLYGEGILAWYSRQTRINRAKGLSWPRVRALSALGYSSTAVTGWTTLFFVGLHVYTTRYLPWKYGGDGETSVQIVSHALRKHPILTYTLYGGLIASATFHVLSGWGRWLQVRFTPRGRRLKNSLVVTTIWGWLAALGQIGRISVFSRSLQGEYDNLYRHVWTGF
jgi:Protein of unknown function (DUF1691)